MGIDCNVGHVEHRPNRSVGGGKRLNDVAARTSSTPSGHNLLKFFSMFGPPSKVDETRVITNTKQMHHTSGDRVAARRGGNPQVVTASISATRDGVRQSGTEAALLLTGHTEQRNKGTHHVEHRFEQVGVDDLAHA